MSKGLVCLVLAAGRSTRFGCSKLMHHLPNGLPMIEQSLANLKAEFNPLTELCVALDGQDLALQQHLDGLGYHYAEVQADESSMSGTLRFAISTYANAEAWLIALADMPYIRRSTISKIRQCMRSDRIVVPLYNKVAGHPVAFGCKFKSQLLQLEGDQGAKAVIRANADAVLHLEVDDPGILADIDYLTDIRP